MESKAPRLVSGSLALSGGSPAYFSSGNNNAYSDAADHLLVHRQKDLYRNLIREHFLSITGREPLLRNPHFARLGDDLRDATVIHFSDLNASCPMPGAVNIQLVGRRELFDLARERMDHHHTPLRRLLGLMEHLLLLEPLERLQHHGLQELFQGLDLLHLPADLPLSGMEQPLPMRSKPIRYQAASFHTGPYNHLNQPDRPPQSSIHMRLLAETAEARKRPYAVLFAAPESVHEAGLLMRIFAALNGIGAAADLLVVFFGTAEDLEQAIHNRSEATFFGDNYNSPAVRCLFAPFLEADLVHILRHATAVFDTAYGGTLDFIAARLELRRRFIIAQDGRFAEWQDGKALPASLDLNALFSEGAIRGRDRKIDRQAERVLLQRLEAVFHPAA